MATHSFSIMHTFVQLQTVFLTQIQLVARSEGVLHQDFVRWHYTELMS